MMTFIDRLQCKVYGFDLFMNVWCYCTWVGIYNKTKCGVAAAAEKVGQEFSQ